MAQFDIFLAHRDCVSIAEFLLREGCWLVPKKHYPGPEYTKIGDMTAFESHWESRVRYFFVLSKEYAVAPLEMWALDEGKPDTKYFIMPRNGGPAIDFVAPAEYEREGSLRIAPGMIAYYPTFWNQLEGANQAVSEALVGCYRRITKMVKSGARKTSPKGFWVARNAAELALSRGAKLIGRTGEEYAML